jgi:predicted GNAT superfamily acetyltransferase
MPEIGRTMAPAAPSVPASSRPVAVRPLSSVADYRRCQDIQRRTWDITEEGYLVPVSLLVSVHKHGGLVLGAELDGELVGFAFAFLGTIDGELGFYSQLTAVLPEYQGLGIGYALKQAQRAEARRRGLAVIAWAFDPLQAGNAAFNLHKLGARCRRYEVDLYGPRSDALNVGLATDRLIAEWRVDAVTPAPRPAGPPPGTRLLSATPEGAWLRPTRAARPSGERLELDIPPDIQALKRQRPDLAALWQLQVRAAFQEAFAARYVATDFARSADRSRAWYVLERAEH